VVRDNGSNFIAGLRDASISNLHLLVKYGCLALPALVDLLAKERKLAGHYKHSNIALQSLLKIEEQLGIPP